MAATANMSRKRRHEIKEEEENDDFMLLTGAAIWFLYLRRKRHAERSIWCRQWLSRREEHGAYDTLLSELRAEDHKSFLNFLRISPVIYDQLLDKVRPFIEKQDTSFRKATTPGLRLAITLRYLATGIY